MADKEEVQAHNAPEFINLKVMGQDDAVLLFKIKKHTPLRKMKNAYCERAGFNIATVRFRFDGVPVNDEDTALSLELEDGDTIEAYQPQTGGVFIKFDFL